ncbi:hypothetical protein [Paraferrimonas haliotis]|uniref:Uncharacterized protein n=1 Tax=Paraferrimonas haliotis TaxID=2013866 RepID=A0AA37WXU3_9GAMM|nr:hypothetical protein [Paraferrimonas haliotis]GLS83030.1 hypothetical protein GCM10007894_10070 [Paraferrimonas haliotis]
MSQDIIIKREIKTETWLIQGEIALADSRPEINCVLQFLHDYPSANSVECSEHLFGDKIGRRVVAERLLNLCRLYGLAESIRGKYKLTEAGKTALKKDQVLIPTDGCWKLCICDEPLLPHSLLTSEAHTEPSAASTGLRKNRHDLKARADKLLKIPQSLKDLVGLQEQPIGGGSEVRVDKIELKGERISPQEKPYYIEWNVTNGNVDVKRGKDHIFSRRIEPISRQQVLKVLLHSEGLFEQWDEQMEILSVVFENTTESERINMKRSVSVKRPFVRKLGSFDAMKLHNISISALTELDAKKWAEWRLEKNINMYATNSKYQVWREKALEPFKGWNFTLPDRAELANQFWVDEDLQNQHTWHVIAAHDWNL